MSAHCINVGQRVGGRDLPEVERIIDNGRKEVHGLNESQIGGDAIHRRIVRRLQPHEKSRVVRCRVHVTQDLRQLGRTELASSAPTVGVGREAHLVPHFHSSPVTPSDACISVAIDRASTPEGTMMLRESCRVASASDAIFIEVI